MRAHKVWFIGLALLAVPAVLWAQDPDAGIGAAQARYREAIKAIADNPKRQEAVQRYQADLDQQPITASTAPNAVHLAAGEDVSPSAPSDDSTLLVFASASMPAPSWQVLVVEAERYQATIVLRGLVGGSLKNTAAFLRGQARLGETGGVVIDPTLFELATVTVVPTVVLLKNAVGRCRDARCVRQLPVHDRLSGNVTLTYALDAFAREGDLADMAAARLRGGRS